MDRRKFLVGLGIALIGGPAAITLNGCGNSSSSGTPAPANTFSVTSNPDNTGHTHAIDFPLADFTNPTGEKTYTSTIVGAHDHTLTLSQQDLTEIGNGGTVGPKTSSSAGSTPHTHTWTVKKP